MSEIKLNDKLPVFSGVNQDGKVIYSQDFLGEKLVIFFYPKANTSGCTAEACNLSDNYHLLKKEGYEILGISVDNIEKQKKFHEKYSFPYDLIADDIVIINFCSMSNSGKIYGERVYGSCENYFCF